MGSVRAGRGFLVAWAGGFRGHGTFLTPRRVKAKRTSVHIINNISGPGRKSRRSNRIQGTRESSHRARPAPASVARRDSRWLLPRLAPPSNHRRQGSQGFVDRDAVREDVKDIVPDHDDVRTLGISRRGSAACRPGEVIFWAHRIVLAGIASTVVLHISFSPFWLLVLRR
jgi:hypothetical protein